MATSARIIVSPALSAAALAVAMTLPGAAEARTATRPPAPCAWKVVQTPDLGQDPSALDAADALGDGDVWAVGSVGGFAHEKTLVEHFGGSSWSRVRSPNPRELSTDGNVLNAIDARTDGSAWSIADAPNPEGVEADSLTAVTALSANDVWAVGRANEATTLTMHFNGKRWRVVTSPNPGGDFHNGLAGIVALSPNDIWAVGSVGGPYGSITLHWNGQSWAVVVNQHLPQFDGLSAVAARSSDDIWAVGQNQTPDGDHLTFGEHSDGSAWTLTTPVSPGRYDALFGVAATTQAIWAFGGTASSSSAVSHVLAERHS